MAQAWARPAGSLPAPADIHSASEQMPWTLVRGQAVEITLGGDGAVFVLDGEGRVWLRPPGDTNTIWTSQPGNFHRIDAASQKLAWAIDEAGAPYRFNGTWWRRVDGRLKDIGVSLDGAVFAVSVEGLLLRYDMRQGFVEVTGAPTELSRVSVDDTGRPWVVGKNGDAQRFDGHRWQHLPGALTDIVVRAGMAYAKGADGQLLRWRAEAGRWSPVAARVSAVAVSGDGKPWVTTADGRIYANHPDTRQSQRVVAQAPTQVFTQILNWRRVPGSAKELAISPSGAILALGMEGQVWQWKENKSWGLLPGTFAHIALEPSGIPWGIDRDGRIFRYRGSYWSEVPGSAQAIAIGANGALWIVGTDDVPARWEPGTGEWKPASPKMMAHRIAVDPDDHPWIVSKDGSVARHDGKRWLEIPGVEAKSISIGPEGTVYVAGKDGRPWRYDRLRERWAYVNGDVAAIAVGPRGQPWIATSRAEIFASSFFEEQRAISAVAASAVTVSKPLPTSSSAIATSKEPLGIASFQLIRNFSARGIAIGNDGSVFALAFDGTLGRWNNAQNKFLPFPGLFARIAVTPDGKPWGVTGRNEVWRHDGSSWHVVQNIQAQDIAIGLNGTVIVAAPDDVLYQYVAKEDRFERIFAAQDGEPAPAGGRVAVDPRGNPWTIARDQVLWRCDRTPCQRLAQSARDIAIGPEGSVFIVDSDFRMRRLNKETGEWDRVGVDADVVAVGPAGKPWLVNGKSEAWASGFFPRDESGDLREAAGTTTVTATAASPISQAPVFTFSVNMPFDQIALPFGFFSGDPINFAFKPDSSLVVIDGAYAFWNFNESLKRFTRDTTVPPLSTVLGASDTRSFVIGKDGTYWVSNDSTVTPKVWRRQGSSWVQVSGLDDCAITPGCGSLSAMSVTVAPDGTVYATSSGDNIYRYDTTLQRFVNLHFPRPNSGGAVFINVDSNGLFWGASPSPALLYQYVGNAWVKRTDSVIGAPVVCLTTKVPCVSLSATGTAYGYGAASKPVRWNPTIGAWETITSSPLLLGNSNYSAAPDGRLWAWTGTALYRSR